MTERVTFFGEKGPEQSERSHRLELETPEGRWVLLAWTGRPARSGDLDSGDEAEYRELVGRLSDQVRQLGGGILAEVQPTSGRVRLHRLPVNGQGDVHRAIRLSPFTGDGEVDLNREVEELQLRRGEHLIVPVSPRAEERMLQLRDLLGGMGPDVEALVLHTLRSPSIEARLGRLEEAVELDRSGRSRAPRWSRRGRRRAKATAQPAREGAGWAARRSRRPGALRLALIALVILLILAAGWVVLRNGEETPAPEESRIEQGFGTGSGQESPGAEEGTDAQAATQPSGEWEAASDRDGGSEEGGPESPETESSSGITAGEGAKR